MRDRDFLEIFDKIDDKFLIETYKENEKLRRGSRRSFFHAVYTAAACIMVAAAAVLVVSSFLDRGGLVQPSSAGDASQIASGSGVSNGSMPDSGVSDSEISNSDTSEPLVYNNTFYYVDTPKLEFPDNYYEMEDDPETSYFYADYQQQSILAKLTLTVKSNYDVGGGDGGIEKIPMRMYLFCDGQQSLFRYDKANIAHLDMEVALDNQTGIDFSFNAGRLTSSAAVVCVFFPGDAARQSCVIKSACNLSGETPLNEIMRAEFGLLEFDGSTNTDHTSILTLNKALHYSIDSADKVLDRIVSEKRECVSGSSVKTLSVNSAYLYTYYNGVDLYDGYLEMFDYFDYRDYTLIALIDGEPAPVFDGEFSALVRLENEGVQYYKLSKEYLSENSTIQLIALPIRTNRLNWWGMSSECRLLTE